MDLDCLEQMMSWLHGAHWSESPRILSVLVISSEKPTIKNYDGSRNYMPFIALLMLNLKR